MIPKVIHYCWFGNAPKPKLTERCIRSWKKYCPDYEIIEWNEDNYDISASPLYVRQAYEAKMWAFVSDYVRLDIIYRYGGIYLDTDVQLIKNLDQFLTSAAFFGYEDGIFVATGLGFGAVKNHPILKELMEKYTNIPFLLPDGSMDLTSCLLRNAKVFLSHGLRKDNSLQCLDGNVMIYPKDYANPKHFWDGKVYRTKNTVSIHHYAESWHTEAERKEHRKGRAYMRRDKYLRPVKEWIRGIIGDRVYYWFKQIAKGK